MYCPFGLKELFCTVFPRQQTPRNCSVHITAALAGAATGLPSRWCCQTSASHTIAAGFHRSFSTHVCVHACAAPVHFALVLNLHSDQKMRRLCAAGHPPQMQQLKQKKAHKAPAQNPPHKVRLGCV